VDGREAVPTTDATVSTVDLPAYQGLLRHESIVEPDQETVPQGAPWLSSVTVAVGSQAPKLMPKSVTLVPPEAALFPTGAACDATGASNENARVPVPTTLATVRLTVRAAVQNPPPNAGARHVTYVGVDHDVVPQTVLPNVAVEVKSWGPNCRPRRLSVAPPVGGVFRTESVKMGPSNVNLAAEVPATSATLSTIGRLRPAPPGSPKAMAEAGTDPRTNVIVVALIHVVDQAWPRSRADGETLVAQKFNPLTVTTAPPDRGALPRAKWVGTGESKENAVEGAVPSRPPTLSASGARCGTALEYVEYVSRVMQATAVPEVQAVVAQNTPSDTDEAVKSCEAKFKPAMVTTTPAYAAMLTDRTSVTTGASYVKVLDAVPIVAPTVMDATPPSDRPVRTVDAQLTMVLHVQLVVAHVSSASCAVAVRSDETAKFEPDSVKDAPP